MAKTTKKKVYLQCGYEDDIFPGGCKKKDCMNCRRRFILKKPLKINHAEAIVIEDFAMCDLESMINGGKISEGLNFPDKKEELELMQNIMRKLMHKLFKCEKIGKKDKL